MDEISLTVEPGVITIIRALKNPPRKQKSVNPIFPFMATMLASVRGPLLLASLLVNCLAIASASEITVSNTGSSHSHQSDPLVAGWNDPPLQARLKAYWWWLNGNVTRKSITHDLEAMKAKGFGGAVIVDAGGAAQDGNQEVPHGPTFFSPEWRELYKHALREADRLGLEISLNIQSGWNLGGPMVTPDDAGKVLSWASTNVSGPTAFKATLQLPKMKGDYYRDTAVLALPVGRDKPTHPPLENWQEKALLKSLLPFSAPDSSPLFREINSTPGEEDARATEIVNLTSKLSPDGTLEWNIPPGDWEIIRFGYQVGDHAHVSTGSEGWTGYSVDTYDADAFTRYWNSVVEPLIADAGLLAGKSLKYLHTDSWEIEPVNWTPSLPREFLKRRGYDMTPWLPVIAGKILNSREESNRFLFDYRKTLGELAIDNHYKLFSEGAHRHGLGIHPESGGPHAVPIDAQQCLGWDDVPMSEFWAWSWTHRIGDENRFFVKQPASAAHTYGHLISQDEGFTTIGPHWQERLWNNLKPSFDQALCEGMNLLVWHAFVCSPDSTGVPGQQYFAGTHLNPKVTWWDESKPLFSYINRCQWMLQQGCFVADVLCYRGDHTPNFSQLKKSDPAGILPGYDYDVITEEALLKRTSSKEGRIVLPDGMSYRILVLPDRKEISLAALRKIKELVSAGATVIGPMPVKAESLRDISATDAEVLRIARELWGKTIGMGRVISERNAREVLLSDGVPPDCQLLVGTNTSTPAYLDYIHRSAGTTQIYFTANRSTNGVAAKGIFRVSGKTPELWNAVTGERRNASEWSEKDGLTTIPLNFAPCGSSFVVFRKNEYPPTRVAKNTPSTPSTVTTLQGPWKVQFDPKWGGPEAVIFSTLDDWTHRPELGIRYYSGKAKYVNTFDFPESAMPKNDSRIWLDLGEVRELASVRVNGRDCGTIWCPPFRADITDAVKAGTNNLEISVVNFWPNRIIGDDAQPSNSRFTRTNVRKLTKATPLMQSGLLGPVMVFTEHLPSHE